MPDKRGEKCVGGGVRDWGRNWRGLGHLTIMLQTNRQYFWNFFVRSSSSESADEVTRVVVEGRGGSGGGGREWRWRGGERVEGREGVEVEGRGESGGEGHTMTLNASDGGTVSSSPSTLHISYRESKLCHRRP